MSQQYYYIKKLSCYTHTHIYAIRIERVELFVFYSVLDWLLQILTLCDFTKLGWFLQNANILIGIHICNIKHNTDNVNIMF